MKPILLMVIAITIMTTAGAQKMDASKVPDAVKTAFAKKYPGVAAKWGKEGSNYEAEFTLKGTPTSVVLEPGGTITETETDIKVDGLPATVRAYVKEHYKGKSIKEGAKITRADGTVNYEAEVDGKDIMFDAEGKFLKVVKD